MKKQITETKRMPQYQAPEIIDILPISTVICKGTTGEGAGDEEEKDGYGD